MVEQIRKSQEEEVILLLKREGFRELNDHEVGTEPYKTLFKTPECFKTDYAMKSSVSSMCRKPEAEI